MTKPEQQFEPGSEQFLAAVLYVARDAQRQWEKHRRGRFGKWWYLTRVRRQLNIEESLDMPYSLMRSELIRFAETFGVAGQTQSTEAIRGAVSAFDDIKEQ